MHRFVIKNSFWATVCQKTTKQELSPKKSWVNFKPWCCKFMQKIRKVPSIEFPQNFKNFIWGPFWPKNFRAKSCPTKISCLNFNSACCCNFVQEWDALHRLTFDNTCKTSFLVNFGISFGQKTSEQSYSPQKNIWLNFKSLCCCNCAKK